MYASSVESFSAERGSFTSEASRVGASLATQSSADHLAKNCFRGLSSLISQRDL